MSGLALPNKGQGSHASINPSALSRPPRGPGDEINEIKQGSGSGSGSGEGKKAEDKDKVVVGVPEITVVEGLVPTLQ
jgi:hypothetical protein